MKYFSTNDLPLNDEMINFWNNQPTTVMGIGVAIFVLLGIYISLLQTYQ